MNPAIRGYRIDPICHNRGSASRPERAVDHLARNIEKPARPSAMRCINVTVHGIGSAERELEPEERETWVSVEQFEHVLDVVAERKDVRISFDDANASDLEIALPRLLERGLQAQFFVLAGLLGESGRLQPDGIRELARVGMSIGSHGWGHRDWRRLDATLATEEIATASRVLSEISGQAVSTVAIPFGSYDRHVLRRLREANVTRVYTSDGGPACVDWWLQPRTSVRHDLDETWLRRTLDERPGIAARARKYAARTVKCVRGRP